MFIILFVGTKVVNFGEFMNHYRKNSVIFIDILRKYFKFAPMKRLLLLMIVILALGATANSQTIRNANNSMLATINTNGEVRNSNNSLVARINTNGEIRDANNHLLGKLDGNTVRNSNNGTLGRIGHLLQDRFKSEPCNDSGYFLTLFRYIHQNPVKAGLVKTAKDYSRIPTPH